MSFTYGYYPEFKSYKGPLTEENISKLMYLCEHVEFPYFLNGVRTQLIPKNWLEMLSYNNVIDPDIHFILDGILNGYNVIDFNSDITSYHGSNYHSCHTDDNLAKLSALIESELLSGKISRVKERPYCVHSLGVLKKKNSTKIRPITDCSLPEDVSVNSFMHEVCDKFSYITVGDVVSSILEGKCEYISTVDLASAYRSVPVNTQNRQYFGFKWKGVYYVDNFLCFGAKSALYIFSRLTDSICRYMRKRNVTCYSYLDDIICISKDFDTGIRDQLLLISVLRNLGFYVAWSKVQSPTRCCTYLGIELDVQNRQMRLPRDRMSRLRKELLFWVGKRKATAKQLEVLLGHLCHCSRIIQGGTLYLHYLFELLREARTKSRVKLTHEFHEDLSWWNSFADHYNYSPMCDFKSSVVDIRCFSGIIESHTEIEGTSTIIEAEKKRHKSVHVAMLLRQLFWHLMYLNVKLDVVYDPFR